MNIKPSPTRFSAFALAIILLGLVASGCGGSKGPTGLSQTELKAKADPICRHTNQLLNATGGIGAQSPESQINALEVAYTQTAQELGRLTPPAETAEDWNAIVAGWRTAGEGLKQLSEAHRSKVLRSELIALGVFTKAQKARGVIARRDGFEDCGTY